MTQTTQLAAPSRAPAVRRRLGAGADIAILASIFVSFLAASSAPTPLYALYQAAWGFSTITTTVIFGTYAVAVLLALLTLGRLSDHVGRRPVVLVGLAVQVLAMVIFAKAQGVPELLVDTGRTVADGPGRPATLYRSGPATELRPPLTREP